MSLNHKKNTKLGYKRDVMSNKDNQLLTFFGTQKGKC